MQQYVKVLIDQNQKAKGFIKDNLVGLPELKRKAELFMQKLENSQPEEGDGQSTETENEADKEDCAVSDFEESI